MAERAGRPAASSAPWWHDAVVYHIYPRSFADSDGDGIGDLRGIRERLDYLVWLGVDAIWLSPIHPSPNGDWGYDVTDYYGVHSDLGSMSDFDDLVVGAQARGIRVILDLVPNHTSDRHPWFLEARSSSSSRHRDWYVWADAAPDGGPPNNWVTMVGEPAWTRDEVGGQCYLHNFFSCQPDLNWWNEEVRGAFDGVLRFWLERGVAGFRIDVAQGIVKDALLRDNPPATIYDPPPVRRLGQRQYRNTGQPAVHEVMRRWRRIVDRFSEAGVLIGETVLFDLAQIASYYGNDDELHLALNFPFFGASLVESELRAVVEAAELVFPPQARPAWFLSSHDGSRFPTRWCQGDERRVRCALVVLVALRGTPVLYYGDEIGMPDTEVGQADRRDPAAAARPPGRDGSRTPMHWDGGDGAGFTSAAKPWLPLGHHRACNVAAQREDPASTLRFCRDLLALRRRSPDLLRGSYRSLRAPAGVWAWRRGDATAVAVNLSARGVTLPSIGTTILLSTRREREGQRPGTELCLRPWEGVVMETEHP